VSGVWQLRVPGLCFLNGRLFVYVCVYTSERGYFRNVVRYSPNPAKKIAYESRSAVWILEVLCDCFSENTFYFV